MSSNLATTTSGIGDPVSLQGIYKGYQVYVTIGGVIVARATEMTIEVDNDLENHYELGSRHPKIVPGNFSCGGSLTGYKFDSMKFNFAVGMKRDEVSAEDVTLGNDTFADAIKSPSFGTQPYFLPPRFTITVELHISEAQYFEYLIKGCLINNWRLTATMPGEVRETVTFVGENILKAMYGTAA